MFSALVARHSTGSSHTAAVVSRGHGHREGMCMPMRDAMRDSWHSTYTPAAACMTTRLSGDISMPLSR